MLTDDQRQQFQTACREAGLKCTHQRLVIFEALAAAMDHPTAESIFRAVRQTMPSISLDTIYRTLDTFERLGLTVRLHVPGESGRYEPNLHPHHHLFCIRCGRIEDFTWHEVDSLPPPAHTGHWGRVAGADCVIRGVCPSCQAQTPEQ